MQGINQDLVIARERGSKLRGLHSNIIILFRGENGGSIALVHNPVFYSRIKHFNIQHHYIRNEMVCQRIKLSYVLMEQIIADGLTKALIYIKFHYFIE